MMFWPGYERHVRDGSLTTVIWLRRARCRTCKKTHVLLPSFLLKGRLYSSRSIGGVLEDAVTSLGGLRPVADRHGIPHTTAREWTRRFEQRAHVLAGGFAAVAVGLGGAVTHPERSPARSALRAIKAAWHAVMSFSGWIGIGLWGFCAAVSGGELVATNTISPYLVVGKRRFMVPVP